jgi:hypothetical protein
VIGILGMIDINYLANIYMAGFLILLGIVSFIAAVYFGIKK